MRQIPTLGSVLLLTSIHAQVIIGPADMPDAGDTLRYATTSANAIDPAITGADVLWDHGDLTIDALGADTAIPVSATPLLYQFFFNNGFLYPQNRADYGMKGQEFGFQGVSLEDVYDYFRSDAGGFVNVGFGATVNGLPASVRRIPIDRIHQFPLAYGDQDTSYSAFEVTIPSLGHFGQTQWRYNTVDGWGTLVLPGGTYNVLRVRSELVKRDTLFVDQFGFGFGFNEPLAVEYKWIAPGMGAPVMVLTTTAGVATSLRFHHDPLGTSVVDEPRGNAVPLLFPNPASDAITVVLPSGYEGEWVIVDAIGREMRPPVIAMPGTFQRIGVEHLADGVYTLRLMEDDERWSARFVVQR